MLAVAIRTAPRMGLHNEATYSAYTAVEAEMPKTMVVIGDFRPPHLRNVRIQDHNFNPHLGLPDSVKRERL